MTGTVKAFVRHYASYTVPLSAGGLFQETHLVPAFVHDGGPYWTVPELFFDKKRHIPALQQLILSD